MTDRKINLIQQESSRLGRLHDVEERLRRLAWWSLGILFLVGVGIGATFLYTRRTLEQVERTKQTVTREINAQSIKEGLLLSLFERVGIASRALSAAKPWGKLFTILETVAPTGSLNSVSVDESTRVTSTLDLSTIDEGVYVATNLLSLFEDKLIRSPQMHSFSLREDGKIQMSISFQPVL